MNELLTVITAPVINLALPFLIFLLVYLGGFLFKRILLRRISELTRISKSPVDDLIVDSLKGPFMLWSAILGVHLALQFSDVSPKISQLLTKVLLVCTAASVTFVVADIASKLIRLYSKAIDAAFPVTSLTQNITRIIIFIVGILIILNNLGIAITPILATLGVGGLAVALALQDTLSNLFSGFHIIISKQIRIGDYIKLESKEEGYVTDINWRSTSIRMLSNNVVLIPNAKLAQAIVVNYYEPDREIAVLLDIGVHYKSDLREVERIVGEVGKEVMREVPGGVPEFDPFIRLHTFGDSSIIFTVVLRAREFVDQYIVKHEFIHRLHKRFQQEGIVIPYPIRTIEYQNDPAGHES